MSPPSPIFDVLARQAEILKRLDRLERLEPVRIVAKYRTDAGQSINNNSLTVVDYEDQDYDSHSAVTTGASWKFTAPVSGYYHITAAVLFTSTTGWAETEIIQLEIYVDGTAETRINRVWGQDSSGGAQFKGARGSDTVYLATGSYIDVRVTQLSGGSLALHNDGDYNFISIEKVG